MAARPHDITDLYLAPVALAVDVRIEELGRLDREQLAYEVALESDTPDFTRDMRDDALIRAITHLIETHDWKFSWDPRGLRLTHDVHTFVLGIPAVFAEYLQGSPTARGLPEVAAGQHVHKRHQRNQAEQPPGQLLPAGQVTARREVDPYQDHRQRVEKADQELQKLLHNRPPYPVAGPPVPARWRMLRRATAIRVFVGLCAPEVTNTEPSAT
jgi:hypothetical protein